MNIKSIKVKPVVTPILRGRIHGQGDSKRYVFVLLETDCGNSFSEIYCGSYDFRAVELIISNIAEKLMNTEVCLKDVYQNFLHKPFVSGAGIHQTVISSIYNCILLIDRTWKPDLALGKVSTKVYLSGGTVKSSIDEMAEEIDFAISCGLSDYKVRLDYRDSERCVERIKFLNQQPVNYAIDLIVNTNHLLRQRMQLREILEHVDLDKLLWLEEPVFPTEPSDWEETLSICKNYRVTVALGESLNSNLEMEFILNHPSIDMIQIDSTHCSDLWRLMQFQARVLSANKVLGYHNWGSYITLLLNGVLNEVSGQGFFEVPFYQTDFDKQVIKKLDCTLEHLCLPCVSFNDFDVIRESIFELIDGQLDKSYQDFSWK